MKSFLKNLRKSPCWNIKLLRVNENRADGVHLVRLVKYIVLELERESVLSFHLNVLKSILTLPSIWHWWALWEIWSRIYLDLFHKVEPETFLVALIFRVIPIKIAIIWLFLLKPYIWELSVENIDSELIQSNLAWSQIEFRKLSQDAFEI